MKIGILISALLLSLGLQAQQVQTVRGVVLDKQSKSPLIGASIVLLNHTPILGAASDINGNFRLEKVPVGRQTIKISYLGYKEAVLNSVMVNSGKETVLQIELEEDAFVGAEVTVKAKVNKAAANNELITVSGRSFSIDETNRFAGSLGDPSRMAANFAGVAGGGNDQRNDIIIRGNSPLGLLWRLDGADIPNPNHFSNQGANGGPVSILNNNTLSNSDFITGAWPSEYGSATSGVFDLKMRNCNNEKAEHTIQMGFNGLELMTEGPIKKQGASYLFSYRYSSLALFNQIGFSFGESGIPYYQDYTFKLNLPTKKYGTFSLWSIAGKSNTNIYDSVKDSIERINNPRPQDIQFASAMMANGLTHVGHINKSSYVKTVLSLSGERNQTNVDTLHRFTGDAKSAFFRSESASWRIQLHSFYAKKINARNNLKTGFIITRFQSRIADSTRDWRFANNWRTDYNFNESTALTQAYANWNHRHSEKLSFNFGLHGQMLLLNNTISVEPRAGASYKINNRQNLSFGYGLHGQGQPLPVYYQETLINEQVVLTNKNLKFTQSHHFVGAYEWMLTPNIRLKTEAYYQQLLNVPVTQNSSSYSVINFGTDFGGLPNVDSLVSKGRGRNYGLEITLERFFEKNYYFLFTTSLFQSQYLASDQKWRNTAFNSNFVVNALAGKEVKIKADNVLSFNLKGVWAGGRREIPVNLAQSKEEGRFVADNENAYRDRLPDYFRVDFRIGYKMNKKKLTHEWAIDLQNVFNIQNTLTRQYNPVLQEMQSLNQIGFFPVPLYRLQF